MTNAPLESDPPLSEAAPSAPRAERLRDLSPTVLRTGLAAWLGWLFDGLDMHLYTLVALPLVAELMGVSNVKDESVGLHSSWIQAAFLMGWALGGGFFGRVGDRLGRSHALMLTILTYASFTGLSFFAQTWWHLLILRFLAALGIGGEWAVRGAAFRDLAASLATLAGRDAANGCQLRDSPGDGRRDRHFTLTPLTRGATSLGISCRSSAGAPGAVDSSRGARTGGVACRPAHLPAPRVRELFQGQVRRTTLLTVFVCGFSLTAHWAFMFWCFQHLRNLPDVASWTDAQRTQLASTAMGIIMVASIAGNYLAAAIARALGGYRRAIATLCVCYFLSMVGAYCVPRSWQSTFAWLPAMGASSGVFALFTMYLPPLFPTLLRTTGAGFCYNIGRVAAAIGTVVFGMFTSVGDYRLALLYASFLFLPAAAVALMLSEPSDEPEMETRRQGD